MIAQDLGLPGLLLVLQVKLQRVQTDTGKVGKRFRQSESSWGRLLACPWGGGDLTPLLLLGVIALDGGVDSIPGLTAEGEDAAMIRQRHELVVGASSRHPPHRAPAGGEGGGVEGLDCVLHVGREGVAA